MLKLLCRFLVLVVLLGVVGFAFLLGVSFGLGNNHDHFISETVPVLSMLSGWVAGVGALAAVVTTLWLADKQRREDVECLKVALNSAIPEHGDTWFMNLQVTSTGKRSAIINGVTFISKHARYACHISGFMGSGSKLPVQLASGERADFHLPYGTERDLAYFVRKHCGGKADGLKIVVSTNLQSFNARVSPHFLTLNE